MSLQKRKGGAEDQSFDDIRPHRSHFICPTHPHTSSHIVRPHPAGSPWMSSVRAHEARTCWYQGSSNSLPNTMLSRTVPAMIQGTYVGAVCRLFEGLFSYESFSGLTVF